MNQHERHDAASELRRAMERLSWSAAKLAEESGVSKNTITRALRGDQLQPGTLRKLREALGIQPRAVEAAEQGGFDADAEVIALAVKVWVSDLPREDRPAALAAIFAAVAEYRDKHR